MAGLFERYRDILTPEELTWMQESIDRFLFTP
jgi:hypothetical protein